MIYRPNPESLAARVLGFFALNPDEELTLDDIAAKFVDPGDSRNVHSQLMAACDHDMLVYDPQDDLYRKGPVSPHDATADDKQSVLLAQAVATGQVAEKPSTTRTQRHVPNPFSKLTAEKKPMTMKPPSLDLAKIKIEPGVPMPEPGHEWRAFLAKFQIGDSAALPARFLMKVRAAMKAERTAGRGSYVSRAIDADTIRVWRTE